MKKVTKNCVICGKSITRHLSAMPSNPCCGRECADEYRKRRPLKVVTKNCAACGKPITRTPSLMRGNPCCDLICTRKYLSVRMSKMNGELNPTRMRDETKKKIRNFHLDSGSCVTYQKMYQRHTHRVIAEQKLGRPLLKGEVVHHRDENKRNNDPDNIVIFASQAEHARYHQHLKYIKENGI